MRESVGLGRLKGERVQPFILDRSTPPDGLVSTCTVKSTPDRAAQSSSPPASQAGSSPNQSHGPCPPPASFPHPIYQATPEQRLLEAARGLLFLTPTRKHHFHPVAAARLLAPLPPEDAAWPLQTPPSSGAFGGPFANRSFGGALSLSATVMAI